MDERDSVTVAKTPYVRFDLNDYSVPHKYVRQTLTLLASTEKVRIIDGAEEIACHVRCYGKKEVIENDEALFESDFIEIEIDDVETVSQK